MDSSLCVYFMITLVRFLPLKIDFASEGTNECRIRVQCKLIYDSLLIANKKTGAVIIKIVFF